ncbi:hypothetical protein RUM43_011518 [Polyplax serrata]|uniref:Uncharacterized protein n=1 Tax=Polyplax serrata TaxID=468196 RepID=A0AAN8S142_POLSC
MEESFMEMPRNALLFCNGRHQNLKPVPETTGTTRSAAITKLDLTIAQPNRTGSSDEEETNCRSSWQVPSGERKVPPNSLRYQKGVNFKREIIN